MGAPTGDPAGAPCTQSGKNELRQALLAERRRAPADARADARRCAALLAIPEVAAARVVTGYTALPGEPDIGIALDQLLRSGVQVLLPVLQPDRDLVFRPVDGDAQVPLTEADVVLVPAVAADRAGRRLGRGGGSYDRALPRVRADALVIAVIHASELLDEIPTEPHDRRVGAVLAGDTLLRIT
jgi:5-formyltetrahydrofolate cyclo-ligase